LKANANRKVRLLETETDDHKVADGVTTIEDATETEMEIAMAIDLPKADRVEASPDLIADIIAIDRMPEDLNQRVKGQGKQTRIKIDKTLMDRDHINQAKNLVRGMFIVTAGRDAINPKRVRIASHEIRMPRRQTQNLLKGRLLQVQAKREIDRAIE
jgi:hypothetical protein